jgi:hypothetical protein
MEEICLSFSQDVIDALRPATPRAGVAESLLRILQILSIAAAGFWTIYVYVTFGERNNDLNLRLATLQELQSRLTIKLTDLDTKKHSIELARAKQNPMSLSHVVTAIRLRPMSGGRFRYLITYNYVITNISERPLNVDRVVVRGFYAKTDHCQTEAAEVNDFAAETPLTWKRVFRRAHLFAEWPPKSPIIDGGETIPAVHGGGGTGVANSGEVLRGGVDLLITAKPSDLIGFKVRMRTGDGQELNDPRFLSAIRIIRSAETTLSAPPN